MCSLLTCTRGAASICLNLRLSRGPNFVFGAVLCFFVILPVNYSVVPLIAYVMSKVFAVILRNFLEVRYTARHGVSMKRLLLIKCAADPLYAFFGDRMPKFWNRQANPLQLNGQYNYGMRALPRDLVGPKILPACLRSMLSTLYSWGSRLWRVRVVLGAALAYNFALFLVELAPNCKVLLLFVLPVGSSNYYYCSHTFQTASNLTLHFSSFLLFL